MATVRVVTSEERNIISNALGLQMASFRRAVNSASANNEPELVDFYNSKIAKVNQLIIDLNNLELFK